MPKKDFDQLDLENGNYVTEDFNYEPEEEPKPFYKTKKFIVVALIVGVLVIGLIILVIYYLLSKKGANDVESDMTLSDNIKTNQGKNVVDNKLKDTNSDQQSTTTEEKSIKNDEEEEEEKEEEKHKDTGKPEEILPPPPPPPKKDPEDDKGKTGDNKGDDDKTKDKPDESIKVPPPPPPPPPVAPGKNGLVDDIELKKLLDNITTVKGFIKNGAAPFPSTEHFEHLLSFMPSQQMVHDRLFTEKAKSCYLGDSMAEELVPADLKASGSAITNFSYVRYVVDKFNADLGNADAKNKLHVLNELKNHRTYNILSKLFDPQIGFQKFGLPSRTLNNEQKKLLMEKYFKIVKAIAGKDEQVEQKWIKSNELKWHQSQAKSFEQSLKALLKLLDYQRVGLGDDPTCKDLAVNHFPFFPTYERILARLFGNEGKEEKLTESELKTKVPHYAFNEMEKNFNILGVLDNVCTSLCTSLQWEENAGVKDDAKRGLSKKFFETLIFMRTKDKHDDFESLEIHGSTEFKIDLPSLIQKHHNLDTIFKKFLLALSTKVPTTEPKKSMFFGWGAKPAKVIDPPSTNLPDLIPLEFNKVLQPNYDEAIFDYKEIPVTRIAYPALVTKTTELKEVLDTCSSLPNMPTPDQFIRRIYIYTQSPFNVSPKENSGIFDVTVEELVNSLIEKLKSSGSLMKLAIGIRTNHHDYMNTANLEDKMASLISFTGMKATDFGNKKILSRIVSALAFPFYKVDDFYTNLVKRIPQDKTKD